jgi:transcription elongation factor GreA
MPSKRRSQSSNPEIILGEAVGLYLSTVSSELSPGIQQDVFKFVRWYGETRQMASLTGQEIANYSEQMNSSPTKSTEHLSTVKQFLVYAHKQGFTAANLSAHVRIKKMSVKAPAKSLAKAEEAIMLTSRGYEELKNKLSALKEERPKMADELRKAAADKDFRENAPLAAAREKQGHIEGKILELENTMKRAKVVEVVSESVLRITFGDTVTISDITSAEKINYTLVGSREANIKQGKISIESPMGQALFNKQIGDVLEVNAPSGMLKYKIMEISRLQH